MVIGYVVVGRLGEVSIVVIFGLWVECMFERYMLFVVEVLELVVF